MEHSPSTPLQPKRRHQVQFHFQEKENVLLHAPPRTPLRIAKQQPTPHSTPVSIKSPAISASKLLRKHFEQISITSPRRRLLDSGAIRIRRQGGNIITNNCTPCEEEDGAGGRSCSSTPETLIGNGRANPPTNTFVQRTDHDPVASTLLQGDDDMDIGVVDFKSGNLMDCPGLIRPVATKFRG